MSNPEPSEIAHRNLCDRVEVLDEIMHNSETPLSKEDVDLFLDRYYPSFVQLCKELRTRDHATSVQVSMQTESIDFQVTYESGKSETLSFSELASDYIE